MSPKLEQGAIFGTARLRNVVDLKEVSFICELKNQTSDRLSRFACFMLEIGAAALLMDWSTQAVLAHAGLLNRLHLSIIHNILNRFQDLFTLLTNEKR